MQLIRIVSLSICIFISSFSTLIAQAKQEVKTQIHYLSGQGKDDMVQWEFFCTDGRNSGEWSTIGVPSCWEFQGYGAYNYGHDNFDDRLNESGLYRYEFELPDGWDKRSVYIVFQGVMTDAEVKINGKLAGEKHQGAFYEFQYDISKLLKSKGKNLLEVKVDKASSNESINIAERKADFWIFGGIFRPVYLKAYPEEYIKRVAVDAKADGALTADLFLNAKSASSLEVTLSDLEGNRLQSLNDLEIEKNEDKWTVRTKAQEVLPWSSEHPELYKLVFGLKDKKGQLLHQYEHRIGFRTVEVLEGDGIYVNGQRVKLKGVNRHSFYPTSGRTTSKALSIEHVKMMKDMNMNAVRMSHYPPDVHFLDACDSLGLFVLDEVCTWQAPSLDTEVGRKIVMETVIRDVNHPSILLWANGNEGGWNTELDDDFALWDIQNREVYHPWGIFRKTNSFHYFDYDVLSRDGFAKDKIFMPTEFLHGLYDGGHGAGLEDYWNLMWKDPLCAGGFLWVFADEGAVRTDLDGIIDTDGNHAPDGIVGPFGEREASYYTIKELWSPIHFEDRYIRDDFNGVFRIENRFHFTNLRDCYFDVKWISFSQDGMMDSPVAISEERIQLPDLTPGNKGSITIDLPADWKKADALYITSYDSYGAELFTHSYPVKSPAALNAKETAPATAGLTVLEEKNTILVKKADLELTFSRSSGKLETVKKDGQQLALSNGPVILGKDHTAIKVSFVQEDEYVLITTAMNNGDAFTWKIPSDGDIELNVQLNKGLSTKQYEGISFTFPETEIRGMKWLGDGPYRVWRNRLKGNRFGIWENEYNNTVTGETLWDYPEFKGFYSNIYWSEIQGKHDNGFKVYCNTPNIYFRMLTPDQPSNPGKGSTVREFPEGDISFLFNIPAIGTKFKAAEKLGPKSGQTSLLGRSGEALEIDLKFAF